jgi:hypothetical protein
MAVVTMSEVDVDRTVGLPMARVATVLNPGRIQFADSTSSGRNERSEGMAEGLATGVPNGTLPEGERRMAPRRMPEVSTGRSDVAFDL